MNAPATLAERSAAAFAARFPHLSARLPKENWGATPVTAGGALVNLDLGGTLLYQTDARDSTAEQLAHYQAKPLRFFLNAPGASNLGSGMSHRVIEAMHTAIEELGKVELTTKPDYDGSFMLILGVGLGYHLPELVRTTSARHILIVEPLAEFVVHSFAAIDWQDLFDVAAERGITIEASFAAQPDKIIVDVRSFISRVGEALIDGAFVYLHYGAWALIETRDRLQLLINDIFISRGFFEDELVMMKNAVRNFSRWNARVLDARPKIAREETAIVVASGPSLDGTAEDLRRLSAQGLVFSCGTGLRACLGHGVVPDFHVEIENTESTYNQIAITGEAFDLKPITLLASVTVDPRVPPLFGRTVFFFRDTVSSTRVFGRPEQEIFGAAPTCVNGAVRTAAAMGITRLVLFGTDCGARAGGRLHASTSLYAVNETFKGYEAQNAYTHALPGNFGGDVLTNWVLNLCQRYLGDVIEYYELFVENTTDGVRIRGTRPRKASTIRKLPVPVDRARFMHSLEAMTQAQPAGAIFDRLPPETLRADTQAMFDAVLAMVDEAVADGEDLVAFLKRLTAFIAEESPRHSRTLSIIVGTLRSAPKIAMFYVHRLIDREQRSSVVNAFFREYRSMVEDMGRTTAALYDDLFAADGAAAAPRLEARA